MVNLEEYDSVENHPCFSLLDKDTCEFLDRNIYCRSYKKGQVLFDVEDQRNRIFLLKRGLIKLERVDTSGSFIYLDFVKQQEVFPIVGLFSDNQYYFSAIAMTDIEVYYFSTHIFEQAIQSSSQQLCFYLNQLSEMTKKQILRMQYSVTSSAQQRVKTTLSLMMTTLGERNDKDQLVIPYPVLINDISKYSGATRETTSQTIKELVHENKLSYLHKELIFYEEEAFSLDP